MAGRLQYGYGYGLKPKFKPVKASKEPSRGSKKSENPPLSEAYIPGICTLIESLYGKSILGKYRRDLFGWQVLIRRRYPKNLRSEESLESCEKHDENLCQNPLTVKESAECVDIGLKQEPVMPVLSCLLLPSWIHLHVISRTMVIVAVPEHAWIDHLAAGW